MMSEIVEVIARAMWDARHEAIEDAARAAIAALDAAGFAPMPKASPPPPDVVGALERLAGMEAFTNSRMVDPDRDAELLARIDFARAILAQLKGEGA